MDAKRVREMFAGVREPAISQWDGDIVLEWIWDKDRVTVYANDQSIEASILTSPNGNLQFEDRTIATQEDANLLAAWISFRDARTTPANG